MVLDFLELTYNYYDLDIFDDYKIVLDILSISDHRIVDSKSILLFYYFKQYI